MRLFKSENVISMVCIILLIGNCIVGFKMNNYKRNFSFVLRYGHEEVLDFGFIELAIKGKNIIDTKYDRVTKDLVRKGSVRAYLRFTENEMNRIKDFIDSHDIMSYPEELRSYFKRYPNSVNSITIFYQGKIKTIEWMHIPAPILNRFYNNDTDTKNKYIVLNELNDLILGILSEKEEYKKLPKPVGGYI